MSDQATIADLHQLLPAALARLDLRDIKREITRYPQKDSRNECCYCTCCDHR